MSKQHHFTVYYDTKTEKWEIADYTQPDDTPIYDSKKEEWTSINGIEDITRDGELLEDLRRRLTQPKCLASFMGGAICILPEGHGSPHASGE